MVTLDRTVPQVLSRTPATADDNVWRGAPVQVVFTEPLLPGTVTEAAVAVSSWGSPVPKTVTLDETGTVLTVQLLALPPLPAQLEVLLGTGITDRAGNALPAAVAAWSWSYPLWQFPGGRAPAVETARLSHLAFDAQGTPQLMFQEGSGAGTGSAWFDGAAWVQRPLMVGAYPGQLAQPANGPLQMSVTYSGGGSPYLSQVWRLGTEAWESPQVVNVLESRTASGRSALVASGEDLYVTFTEVVSGQAANVYVQRQQAGVWSPVGGPLDRTLTNTSAFPAIAVDDAGLPMVAFGEYSGGLYGIFVNRWNGGNWVSVGGDVREVATDNARDPKLLWTGGVPMVAYCQVSGSTVDLRVARWFEYWDYTQVNDEPLSTSGFCMEFDLVQSPASGPVAIYPSYAGTSQLRLIVARFVGDRWDPVANLPAVREDRPAFLPSASFDAAGTLWVSWTEENDREGTDVMVARYNGTFGTD